MVVSICTSSPNVKSSSCKALIIVVQRVENRMKGGVPSVDGLQSGQGASHRNLRGHLTDGWEMVNEQIGFHKEK